MDPSLFERFRGDLDTLYRKESPRGEKRESAERMSVTLRSIRTEPVGLYDQEMALLDQFLRDTKNEEQLEK